MQPVRVPSGSGAAGSVALGKPRWPPGVEALPRICTPAGLLPTAVVGAHVAQLVSIRNRESVLRL